MGETGFFEKLIFSLAAGDDGLRCCFPVTDDFGVGICREGWSFVKGMLSPSIGESAVPEFFGSQYFGFAERLLAPAFSVSLLVFSLEIIRGSRTGCVVGAAVLCPHGNLLYLGVVSVDGSGINK